MKKYSVKFWIFFWLSSAIFLIAWFLYWNTKYQGMHSTVEKILSVLPIEQQMKNEYEAFTAIGYEFLQHDGKEKNFLILFQNNLEIRPGGGFLGSFAVLKIKNGKILSMETHDLANFDANIPATLKAPYPIAEVMHVNAWKMRDSNFSPNFEIDAKQAINFYHMGGGKENIDGVIGMTSNVLTSILKITGPVSIEKYPGNYNSENAILSLEYQVEKAFEEQGIDRGQRKSIMGDLARVIEQKIFKLSTKQKIELAKMLQADLNKKDIQMQFNNPDLEKIVKEANWAGDVNTKWNNDYLMVSDANLGAYKSDYYVKRAIDYTVDFSKDEPIVNLQISYNHTATKRDWMTTNYLTYLRIYVPEKSNLESSENFDNIQAGNEFGKNYFGAIVKVPLGTSKTVKINYTLPNSINEQNYKLLIQKQSGINDVPVNLHIIKKDGSRKDLQLLMNGDINIENKYHT